MWDSRTIHGGVVGPGYESAEDCPLSKDKFARLAFAVCMAPKSKVIDKNIFNKRLEAFTLGIGTDHWPYEFNKVEWNNSYTDKDGDTDRLYKPVEMTKEIKELIGC